ncbi:ribonuclease HII [Maribacter sp. MMG018]|uniref:ribonuclease HII n=1 Tax=Maribacter sp. MMG018 TaxID=2822688 RepID=UPI001B38A705|nr:ribonuclease HII [Maribacter sp. MMG018]MBQ4915780.1 ribonuclease HII [Maribacter sp. MMG018]
MRVRILLLFFSAIYFTACSPKKEPTDSLLNFVPENVSVIVKINDLNSFKSEIEDNDLISNVEKLDFSEKISNGLRQLKYIQSKTDGLLAILENSQNSFDFVYVSSDTLPILNMDNIKDKTLETIENAGLKIDKYTLNNTTFNKATIKNKQVISSSEILLLNIKENIERQKGTKNDILEKFNKLSDPSKSAQIWVDLSKGEQLYNHLLNIKPDTTQSFKHNNWLSLDVNLKDDQLLLNGITVLKDSTNNYLKLFTDTKPLPNTTAKLIPTNTDSYRSITFNDFKSFSNNREKYLDGDLEKDSILSTVEEIGIAQINGAKAVVLKTYGAANITDFVNNLKSSSIDFQGSEILELRPDNFISKNLSPIIDDFTPKYASIIENTFVFSKELAPIKDIISTNKGERSLANTVMYKNTENITTDESTILTVSNFKGFQENLKQNGYTHLANDLKNTGLSDYLFGSQIIADHGFLHTNYFLKKISESENLAGVSEIFNIQLETDILLNPQFFTNHRTNKKEIVVQDQDNVLYLISTQGKILWKKQLESAVQGKIHEIDIYKNGKFQLAFTTNNRFFVIDRNGKEVAPFTFKYEGGNLNPLAVFDYEGNKNYRFVVTQNDKVFMYNSQGNIVSGFKYTKAKENIIAAPQHFNIGQKDYLVFRLNDGSLKILNRVGNVRVKVSQKFSFSENDVKVHKNKFVITTKDGVLYKIDTKGNIEKADMKLNADHGMDATSRTLVLMDDNILTIRDKKVALELGVYTKPSIFYLNDKIYVSVTDIQNQKSYLFDSQAKPISGFPIFGTSTIDMADMDNDKRPELVIKDLDNSFIVYKIR